MIKYIIFAPLCLLTLFCGLAGAQKKATYTTLTIPDSVKHSVNAMIRYTSKTFTIINESLAKETIKTVTTIFNKNGDKYAKLYIPYNKKLTKISDINGRIINELGIETRKLKQSDVNDYSDMESFSLYDDSRIKVAGITATKYPYTVEYEYEIEHNGLLFYPVWVPQWDTDVPVEKADFEIIVPNGMSFRYRDFNIDKTKFPNKTKTKDGASSYKWSIENMAAFDLEYFSPEFKKYGTIVYTAPNDFEIEGYKGNMSTWELFGKWNSELNAGRDVVSEATIQKIKNLTANCKDTLEMARKIYEYVQSTTRYANVSLGIGGWQTREAETVERLGYGDCKALSNYTKALMNIVGIKAHYTLIQAGANPEPIMVDFPISRFNHIILCLPTLKDTIWLECTNQTAPFGYLNTSTDDRSALLITENGGEIAHTTVYKQTDNVQNSNITVNIDETGSANIDANFYYSGIHYKTINYMASESNINQREWINKYLNIPNIKINAFKFDVDKQIIPKGNLSVQFDANNLASRSGRRSFVQLNQITPIDIPIQKKPRKTDIVLRHDWVMNDTIHYNIPENLNVEFMPYNTTVTTKFGIYNIEIKNQDKKVTYIRNLSINKGIYPAKDYNEFADFVKTIIKNDKIKLVLNSEKE